MIIQTFKGSLRVLAGISAGLAIFLLLLMWKLSLGPISLVFLSPYIENMVNQGQTNFRLKLSDTILTWGGWDHSPDIRVLDVQILNLENEVIGNIPELSFSLDRSALLKGEIAPNFVELFGPKLHFIRELDGSMNIGFGETKGFYGGATSATFLDLLDGPRDEHPLRYLKSLNIISADVSVDDQMLETSWVTPSANIYLRRDDLGVQGRISLVLDVKGKQTELELIGRYKRVDKTLEITADIDKISIAPFAPVFGDIDLLKKFNVPLRGSVALSFPIFGGSHSVRFDVKGDAGKLSLPEPFNNIVDIKSVAMVGEYYNATGQTEIRDIRLELSENQLNLPMLFDDMLNIKSLTLAGSYSSRTGIARIQEMRGQIGPSHKINILAPFNHKIPLRAFSLSGIYYANADWLDVSEFIADLNGPQVLIKGSVGGAFTKSETVVVQVDGELNNVPVNNLSDYWPNLFWPDAHDWINKNLADGTLNFVKAKSSFLISDKGVPKVEFMEGSLKLTGVSVDYLPPMPKGKNITADIVFDQESMDITITKGQVSDIKMHKGHIALHGLNDVDQYADINLTMDGSVRSTLAFVDNKPLAFASIMGVDPKNASGKALTDLNLKFIIENNLTVDKIDIQATSKLTNLALDEVFLGRGIHDSTLDLKIDAKGMIVTGDVNYESIPAQLVWIENFKNNSYYQSRYDLAVDIKDFALIRDLGLDIPLFPDKYLKGPIGANIRFTVFDDVDRRLEVQADITETSFQSPKFHGQSLQVLRGGLKLLLIWNEESLWTFQNSKS